MINKFFRGPKGNVSFETRCLLLIQSFARRIFCKALAKFRTTPSVIRPTLSRSWLEIIFKKKKTSTWLIWKIMTSTFFLVQIYVDSIVYIFTRSDMVYCIIATWFNLKLIEPHEVLIWHHCIFICLDLLKNYVFKNRLHTRAFRLKFKIS